MEVFFVDVGQGSCHVILLGGRRAVVVDCGSERSVRSPLHLLKRLGVDRLASLIVSHNHSDHAGGAAALLTAFEGNIDRVCFLTDAALRSTKLLTAIQGQIDNKTLKSNQIFRFECDGIPRVLLEEHSSRTSLKILAPVFLDNIDASTPNETSGVLLLSAHDRTVVFAGDSSLAQWRRIHECRGDQGPLQCDLLAVPHHGGLISSDSSAHKAEIQRFYAEYLRPRYSVISVGTRNPHDHPRDDVVQALVDSGSRVLCTQITPKCACDLESLRPGVLGPEWPGRSSHERDVSKSGKSRNLACAGTVRVELAEEAVRIERFEVHQAAVDRIPIKDTGRPLCRTGQDR